MQPSGQPDTRTIEEIRKTLPRFMNLRTDFEGAETASLANEDVVPYSQSEQRLYDEEMARLEYGMAKEKEGRKEGIKEGFIKGINQMAKALKEAGVSIDIIKESSGLSSEAIAAL